MCSSASRPFTDNLPAPLCLWGSGAREARVTSEEQAGSRRTKCGTAAGVHDLCLGIKEGVGHFPEFIFSVLSLIHCFAPFRLKHHIPLDMTTFPSPFWGELFVCIVGCFSKILLRQCNTAQPCVRAAPFWKMENKS